MSTDRLDVFGDSIRTSHKVKDIFNIQLILSSFWKFSRHNDCPFYIGSLREPGIPPEKNH